MACPRACSQVPAVGFRGQRPGHLAAQSVVRACWVVSPAAGLAVQSRYQHPDVSSKGVLSTAVACGLAVGAHTCVVHPSLGGSRYGWRSRHAIVLRRCTCVVHTCPTQRHSSHGCAQSEAELFQLRRPHSVVVGVCKLHIHKAINELCSRLGRSHRHHSAHTQQHSRNTNCS